MSRRVSALIAAGALASAAASVPASYAATTRATTKSASVALYGDGSNLFRVAKNLTTVRAHRTTPLKAEVADPSATAINPVGGNDGLISTAEDRIWTVQGLRTTPSLRGGRSSYVDISGFTQEGASGFGFVSCDGLAMHGTFGLATGDEEGVIQLVRKKGTWRIDKRVQFPGLNEGGHPHSPGFVRFDKTVTGSDDAYNAVAIAPKAQADGKFLGVALDRVDGSLVVIDGVGTASPQPVGFLASSLLFNNLQLTGSPAVVFLPGSANRAVVATTSGFAVLALRTPSAPALKVVTTVAGGSVSPTSLSVSSDGNHLAVAVGGRIYGYRNVLGAVLHRQPFIKQVSFRLGTEADELVDDVGYTVGDRLAVIHGSAGSTTHWALTVVGRVTAGHHKLGASFPMTQPFQAGTLSVWPAF